MRLTLSRKLLAVWLALSLAGCEKPPPPVAVPPPPPQPPPVTVRRPVTATWNFQIGELCSATAVNSALALDVTASRNAVTLVARVAKGLPMPATRLVPMEFTGTNGSWAVTGRKSASHRVIATQPMTEDQAGQILVLLEGGVIRVGKPNNGLPPLQVPNSGPPGRDWFECVRRHLFP